MFQYNCESLTEIESLGWFTLTVRLVLPAYDCQPEGLRQLSIQFVSFSKNTGCHLDPIKIGSRHVRTQAGIISM